MAEPARLAYLLLGAAAAIGDLIALLWLGVAWLLSYSDSVVLRRKSDFNATTTRRPLHPLVAVGPMG